MTTNTSNHRHKNKFPAIWWNESCEKAVRIRKAKWLSLQHKFTRIEFLEYKKLEAQTKILLKTEKKGIPKIL